MADIHPLPPPPPEAEAVLKGGIHGPRTNFFPKVRVRLSSLEQFVPLKGNKGPGLGLLVALIISATFGLGIAFLLQIALTPVGMDVLTVLFAPLTEEPIKAIGMFVVVFFIWKVVPNRRYGAALGAASGLGFGVAESILYIYNMALANYPAEYIVVRIIVTPFMHPLWSAFVGISVFAFASRKSKSGDSSLTLPLMFLFLGIINHIMWNGISVGLSSLWYLSVIVNLFLTFPVFSIILRDFLGGHFNFQNFFQPLLEPYSQYLAEMPSPPPPPPPPP